jgi:hypothetical protein
VQADAAGLLASRGERPCPNDGAVIEIDSDHQMPLTAPGILANAPQHATIVPG